MKGWSTAAILAVLTLMPIPAFAQAPMSPVYPTGSQKSAASAPSSKAQAMQTWQEPAPLDDRTADDNLFFRRLPASRAWCVVPPFSPYLLHRPPEIHERGESLPLI